MVLSVKPAAPAAYYFQKNGLESHEGYASGVWAGRSKRLGVVEDSPVDADVLDLLLRRQTPDLDTATFNRSSLSSGWDFVFSAPKSVSIAWAFGGETLQEQIEVAQMWAVKAAVELFFCKACLERKGKGGRRLHQARGVAALFNHFTTRKAIHFPRPGWSEEMLTFCDPNVHTHVVAPDLVTNGNDDVLKIVYTGAYRLWSMALGAWYHAHLAFKLRELGLRLVPSHNNGLFQLVDPKPGQNRWAEWIPAFSARTTGAGLVPPLRRKEACFGELSEHERSRRLSETRVKFTPIHAKALRQSWEDYADEIGFDRDCLRDRIQHPTQTRIAEAFVKLTQTATDMLAAHEAVFREQDLFRALAVQFVELELHATPKISDVEDWIACGDRLEALQPTRTHGLRQWTTGSNLLDEERLQTLARTLSAEVGFPLPKMTASVQHAISGLTHDQSYVARRLLSSPSRLQVVTGAPGTGKTHLLEPVVRAFEECNGFGTVIGAAEAWRPALGLKERFGIDVFSLARLFHDFTVLGIRPKPNTVLLVDEAGLLSTRRMLDLLNYAHSNTVKVILVGDDGQLNPIGAGSGLRLLRHALICDPRMSLSEIVRPSDEVQRSIADGLVALQALRREHPYEATTSQRDVDATSAWVARQWVEARRWHSEKSSEKAVDRIVEALLPPSPGNPLAGKSGGVVALARSHCEVQHVTRRLRRRMRDAGLLTGPDFRLIAVTPMGVANRLDIAIGDRIRFLARSKRLDVYNGTCAAIVAIDGNPKAPRISVEIDELNGGKRSARFLVSEFFDKEARVQFAPAYVSTIYGAQGITEENIIILKAAAMSFREFYVGATRARASCEIVEVHPKRAFLNANENTRDQMICDIAAELTRAVRQDRPKAVAEDHRAPSNRTEPAKKDWTFAKMLQPAEP